MLPNRLQEPVYAAVRIVFGFIYLVHGLQKTLGLFGGTVQPLTSLLGVAGAIETVAGALIVLGLYTRPAAFIASGQMAAAYFIAHLPRAFWPVDNGGEPAVLLSFGFLYMAIRGGGPFSLDAMRRPAP